MKKVTIAKLDKIFSEYIRLRDNYQCIVCGKIGNEKDGIIQNGHLLTRSHYSTRFDEDNCHAQCKSCNYKHEYEFIHMQMSVIAKIGQERYEQLYLKFRTLKKYKQFEMIELYEEIKNKIKKLKNIIDQNK